MTHSPSLRQEETTFTLESQPGYAVHDLLGHKDVKTATVYTHVLGRGQSGVRSSADALQGGERWKFSRPIELPVPPPKDVQDGSRGACNRHRRGRAKA